MGQDTRARANHALYLAKILLAAWRRELERQDLPAVILAQAFHGAVRMHLEAAYGWFLLAVSQSEPVPGQLPSSCEQLPAPPEGRVLPPEINEFRQLEASGWLREMLSSTVPEPPPPRQRDNLATAGSALADIARPEHWLRELESLFSRMGDALDEY